MLATLCACYRSTITREESTRWALFGQLLARLENGCVLMETGIDEANKKCAKGDGGSRPMECTVQRQEYSSAGFRSLATLVGTKGT